MENEDYEDQPHTLDFRVWADEFKPSQPAKKHPSRVLSDRYRLIYDLVVIMMAANYKGKRIIVPVSGMLQTLSRSCFRLAVGCVRFPDSPDIIRWRDINRFTKAGFFPIYAAEAQAGRSPRTYEPTSEHLVLHRQVSIPCLTPCAKSVGLLESADQAERIPIRMTHRGRPIVSSSCANLGDRAERFKETDSHCTENCT